MIGVNKALAVIGCALFSCICATAAPGLNTVPAWRNAVDKWAAAEATLAYTSNVVRCEWAGSDVCVTNLMPANLGFQFAVIGDSDVTNRVQGILQKTVNAINPDLRVELERFGLLNSTLQWLVRFCRPGITNVNMYVAPCFHPAAFVEKDFNLAILTNAARNLTGANIPLPVKLDVCYAPNISPLGKATPMIDYPDILPEETFVEPFGAAIVIRAPEVRRKIRLRATSYPFSGRTVRFVWMATGIGQLLPWSESLRETPAYGCADFVYDTYRAAPRLDVLVFAQNDCGVCGAPTVLSIYNPPLAKRKYAKSRLQSIEYLKQSNKVLYDISPIWIPHEWRDDYSRDSKGRMISFDRYLPGEVSPTTFAANGQLALFISSSGYPLTTRAIEYFIDSSSGTLSYRQVGPELKYKLGAHPLRRSGE